MPIKTPPRTGVITTTTGTGAYALGAALGTSPDLLFTFAQAKTAGWIADGDQIYYTCNNASGGFEEGIGTYNDGAQTLTRTTILKSSNGGSAVSWGSGNKSLFSCWPSAGIALTANNGSDYTASTFRTNIGATATGASLFTAANAAAARTALGVDAAFANTVSQLFGGPSAPSGWTQDTSKNDKVLRVVSGTGGGSGGAWTISGGTVGSHTLTIGEIPQHTHDLDKALVGTAGGTVNIPLTWATGSQTVTSSVTGGGAGHTHPLSFDGTWRPAYIDVIWCTHN